MKKHLQSLLNHSALCLLLPLALFLSCTHVDPHIGVSITSPEHGGKVTSLTEISGEYVDEAGILDGEVHLYLQRDKDGKYWNGTNATWGPRSAGLLPTSHVAAAKTWHSTGPMPTGADLVDGYYKIEVEAYYTNDDDTDDTSAFTVGISAPPVFPTAYGWGADGSGQLGVGYEVTAEPVPTAVYSRGVLDGKIVMAVAAGGRHTLALTSEQRVYAWGLDDNGQLGRGNVAASSQVPVAVSTAVPSALAGKKVKAIAAGWDHSLAVDEDGLVYAWGTNEEGQLGTGSASAPIKVPTAVTVSGDFTGKKVRQVAAGFSASYAVTTDGQLFSWGGNSSGQLGIASNTGSALPVRVMGPLAGKFVTAVAARVAHVLALTSTGEVYAWGANGGALGNGGTADSNTPVQSGATGDMAGKKVTAISVGSNHSLALDSTGKVYGWGLSFSGEVGTGDSGAGAVHTLPVQLVGGLSGRKATRIAAGAEFSVATTEDNKVFTWGLNDAYQLAGFNPALVPTEVVNAGFNAALAGGRVFLALTAGDSYGTVLIGFPPEGAPEIEVEAQGVELTDGGTINCGTFAVGTSNPVSITIRNRGSADLANLSALVTGSSSFFGIFGRPPLEPNGDITFDIFFVPTAVSEPGPPLTATLQISSNDADESPFDITLTGTSTPMGQVDLAFNGNIGFGPMQSLSLQPDGKVLVGASAFTVNGSDGRYVARLNAATGNADSFNPDLSAGGGSVLCSAVLPDGKVMIGGTFTTVDGVARNRLARLNYDGTLDTAFDAQIASTGTVFAIALQGDGKLVVSGNFSGIGGGSSPSLARLNPNGTLDTTFVPAGFGGRGVAVQWDGKIVAGGGNGAGAFTVSRLSGVDGSLDPSFTRLTFTASTSGTECVAVQPDGKILVGGTFTAVNGEPRNRICRLNSNGTLDMSFNPDIGGGISPRVTCIVVQANGRILVSGDFTTVGGQTRNRIAMLLPDGQLDQFFDPNADVSVRGVALQADGKILAGGGFNNIGGEARGKLARLSNDVATQSLRVTSSGRLIEWVRGGSSPETHLVTFDVSSDGGTNWTPLGQPGRILVGSTVKWIMLHGSVPATGHVRARAYCQGGYYSGSVSILETITAYGTPPDIVVTENSVSLSSGFTRDFGVVATGRGSAVMQLTLQNAGGTTLTGLSGVTITDDVWEPGDHASQFQLGKPADISLAPGATTTMTVTYRPRASVTTIDQPGSNARHWAWLRIPSDDPDENPIDIRLTGMGGLPFTTYKQQDNGDSASPDTDDSDGNGQSDLQEYATRTTAASTDGDGTSVDQPTGGSPFAPTANGAPPVGGTFLFHYRRYKLALADIVYQVEWSDTLAENDWHTTGVTEVIDSDNDTIQMVTATVPAGTAGRRFARLKMTRP